MVIFLYNFYIMANTQIILKGNVRIYVSNYTEISQTAIEKHKTLPLASLALSTAIAVFGPLSTMKKFGRTIAFYKFNGPLKNILVESNVEGDIRALVGDPFVSTDYDKKDVNEIPLRVGLGEVGTLRIVNEYNDNQFGGEVEMANGDITTDLALYFDQSEQTQTAVVSDVIMDGPNKVKRSWSAIFQLLPTRVEEDIKWIEDFIKNNKMSSFETIDEYINKISGSPLETKEVRWKCKCSQEKMEGLLKTVTEEERKQIIEEHGTLEITCNFCNTVYKFD